MNAVPLASFADVSSGITLRGTDASRPAPNGNFCLLKIGDLREDGVFDLRSPTMIHLDTQQGIRHKVHFGDVLLATRGTRATAAIYDATLPAVAGGQLCVIRLRPDSKVVPEYLHWYLNRPDVQANLMDLSKGSHVQAISLDDIRQFSIPVPHLAAQNYIKEFIYLQREEARLTQSIAEKRALLLRHHLQAIATGQIDPRHP
jgi:Type I restriction modification DNA specificity domain